MFILRLLVQCETCCWIFVEFEAEISETDVCTCVKMCDFVFLNRILSCRRLFKDSRVESDSTVAAVQSDTS